MRHIHWKSSAKASKLQVRQFEDTRRSEISIAIDPYLSRYESDDDLELAISVGASLAIKSAQDGISTFFATNGGASYVNSSAQVLERAARMNPSNSDIFENTVIKSIADKAKSTTILITISSHTLPFDDRRRLARRSGGMVKHLNIGVGANASLSLFRQGGGFVASISSLSELQRLIAREGLK
jgi:uncharacterized protein (DUF58 family)